MFPAEPILEYGKEFHKSAYLPGQTATNDPRRRFCSLESFLPKYDPLARGSGNSFFNF